MNSFQVTVRTVGYVVRYQMNAVSAASAFEAAAAALGDTLCGITVTPA